MKQRGLQLPPLVGPKQEPFHFLEEIIRRVLFVLVEIWVRPPAIGRSRPIDPRAPREPHDLKGS